MLFVFTLSASISALLSCRVDHTTTYLDRVVLEPMLIKTIDCKVIFTIISNYLMLFTNDCIFILTMLKESPGSSIFPLKSKPFYKNSLWDKRSVIEHVMM